MSKALSVPLTQANHPLHINTSSLHLQFPSSGSSHSMRKRAQLRVLFPDLCRGSWLPSAAGQEGCHQAVNIWMGLELGIILRTSFLQPRASIPSTWPPTAECCPPRKQSIAPCGLSKGMAHPDEGKRGSNLLKHGQRRLVRVLSCQSVCTGKSPQLRLLLSAPCTPENQGWDELLFWTLS